MALVFERRGENCQAFVQSNLVYFRVDQVIMKKPKPCKILPVGKRRDGGTRYWCVIHKADATAKYGIPNQKCRYSHIPPIQKSEQLELNLRKYKGGVAIWGAVPPIYDTTKLPMERGVHVHARKVTKGKKKIDASFKSVTLIIGDNSFELTELDAIYFMVSSVFGMQMKYIECPKCNWPHLDKDWFSVHPHRRHLCSSCGRNFKDSETGVGNPISELCNVINCPPRKKPRKSNKRLNIKQSDYPGGIQIWGSNPAILWTGGQHEEEGIHVHLYSPDSISREEDETFGSVTIDDVDIQPDMVRTLMAQLCLPHLKSRLISLDCNTCGAPYFDEGAAAYTPTVSRNCKKCGSKVQSSTRFKKVISNPLIAIFEELELRSLTPRQTHDLELVPETI